MNIHECCPETKLDRTFLQQKDKWCAHSHAEHATKNVNLCAHFYGAFLFVAQEIQSSPNNESENTLSDRIQLVFRLFLKTDKNRLK